MFPRSGKIQLSTAAQVTGFREVGKWQSQFGILLQLLLTTQTLDAEAAWAKAQRVLSASGRASTLLTQYPDALLSHQGCTVHLYQHDHSLRFRPHLLHHPSFLEFLPIAETRASLLPAYVEHRKQPVL